MVSASCRYGNSCITMVYDNGGESAMKDMIYVFMDKVVKPLRLGPGDHPPGPG